MNASKGEETVFAEALRLPPQERAAYLAQATHGDAELRRRVEALLGSYPTGDFLEQAAAAQLRQAVSVPLTEKPGDRIGRYKLLEQIGEGGCGVVYVAEQTEPVRRRVALKIVKLGMDTKSVIARFEAERQALALMDHPNIARVFDAGATETGRPYFVMELVRGVKITEYCDEKRLSTDGRLDLFIQVCQAIQHAHQKGIIHRDIKPSNILVTVNDGVAVPKVIDFGVAKATGGQQLTDKTVYTAFEQFIGTPAYMSPEQAVLTSLDIDTRSDIYALGVLLYELLTGRTPFDAKKLLAIGLDEMRRTIREKEPERPSTCLSTLSGQELSTTAQRRGLEAPKLVSELRGDLDWIVMKCLEKDRARRYETANGLAMDIKRHLNNEPVVACPPSRWYEFQKTVRRHKFGVAATAAVIVALGSGLAVAGWMFLQERAALQRAVTAQQRAKQERDRSAAAEQRSKQERDRALAAESEAHKQRDRAQTFATESHRRLVRRYVMEGNRLVEEGDLFSALLPFAMALKEDKDEPSRADLDRLRLSTTLQQCPKLAVACFPGGALNYAEFSPDGSRILTASHDRTAEVWNAATGSPLTPPLQHSNDVVSARFSPDGKWVVTASFDGTAQVWNARTGERRGPALRHPGPVRSASFSPDNRWVVTTCEDEAARVWDAATGKQYGQPLKQRGGGGMRGAEFSSDGGRILVTSYHLARVWTFDEERNLKLSLELEGSQAQLSPDGGRVLIRSGDNAEIWDVVTGERIISLRVTSDTVDSSTVSFSPDGERVATTSSTRKGHLVQVWDARTGELVAPSFVAPGADPMKALSFSPDGHRLLTAEGNAVSVWDLDTGQLAYPPLTHGGTVRSAMFSRDGRRVLTSSEDASARIWNLGGGELARPSVEHPDLVNKIIFHPDARRVMTISVDGTAVFWDLESAKVLPFPTINLTMVSDADFSPDGRLLALAKTNGTAGVWDLATGRPVGSPMSHQGRVNSIEFSSDGRRVVTAGADGAVRIWRVNPGGLITRMSRPGPVNFASFTPDGQRVVSTMVNTPDELLRGPGQKFVWPQEGLIANVAEVSCWDATSGQLIGPPLTFSNGVTEIVLSPDRLHAITACSKADAPGRLGYTEIWDLSGGTNAPVRLVHEATLVHGKFSPDGTRVVTSGRKRTTRLWDATTGEMLTAPLNGGFSDCTFSPDGRLVATSSDLAPEVRLWDAATGWLVGPPLRVRPQGVVNRIAFSPDGKFLVVATSDNHAQALKTGLAPRPLEDDLLLAEMLAGRTLEESDPRQAFRAYRLQPAWEKLHVRYPEEFGVTWEQLESRFREEQVELKKVLGDSNPQLASSLTSLAEILRNECKWTEAETRYRELLSLYRTLPDQEQNAAVTLYQLAVVLDNDRKPAEAETRYRESLARFQKLPDQEQNAAIVFDNLVNLLGREGKLAEATALIAEITRIAATSKNPTVLNEVAWILATSPYPELRDGSNAIAYAEKIVAATGRTNENYLGTLAAAYAETGKFDEAAATQKEVIALLPKDNTEVGFAQRLLSLYQSSIPYRDHGQLALRVKALLEAGKFTEAEPLARECLTLREKLIPNSWLKSNAQSMLGRSLLGQQEYAKAGPLLLSGYEGMMARIDQIPPQGRPRIAETLQRLVQLYEATGPADRAAKWRQKLAEFEDAKALLAGSPESKAETK